jgi:hypothetical protein
MDVPDKEMQNYLKGYGVDFQEGENVVNVSKGKKKEKTADQIAADEWLKKYGSSYMGGKRKRRRTRRKKRKTKKRRKKRKTRRRKRKSRRRRKR